MNLSIARNSMSSRTTRLAFFMAGMSMSAWVPLIPFAKERAMLDNGSLGIILFGLGIGASVTMPLVSFFTSKLGCRKILTLAVILIVTSLPLLATFSSLYTLLIAMIVFGAGIGIADSVINIQAVMVEKAHQKTMMPGFHGMFSLGTVAGAAGTSFLLSLGLFPLLAAWIGVFAILLAFALAYKGILTVGINTNKDEFKFPKGIILFLGVLCFISFLLEGTMLDWSAVYLVEQRIVTTEYAGWGYVLFAIILTIGRLSGNYLLAKFSYKSIVTIGGLLAVTGLFIAIYSHNIIAVFAGYALIGLGIANLTPILFTLAGKQTALPQAIAIPTLTTMGYSGILMGPAIIGFIATLSSLSISFAFVAILLLFACLSIRYIKL